MEGIYLSVWSNVKMWSKTCYSQYQVGPYQFLVEIYLAPVSRVITPVKAIYKAIYSAVTPFETGRFAHL